jgi:hypothetical protein
VNTKKHKVMLDGARVGSTLEDVGNIELTTDEMVIIKNILVKNKAVYSKGEYVLHVENKSTMQLVLRKHLHFKNRWYINLSGNPLTFFEGSNTYGWPEADLQVVAAFKYCITYAQRIAKMHFPQRIKEAIVNLEFNINSLEFACYTKQVKDKDQVLNAWDYMYRVSDSFQGLKHISLEKLLNVKRINTEYENSFSLALLRDKKYEVLLMLYDKEAQMLSKGLEVPEDIKDRLRVDLGLTSYWFKRRSIRTMKQFVNYVELKGGWKTFIANEITIAFNKTCLLHMFSFPEESIINGSYKLGDIVEGLNNKLPLSVYQSLMYARANFYVTDSDKMEALKGNGEPLLTKLKKKLLPSTVLTSLYLDTGAV